MSRPPLTVIVPAYNEAATVGSLLDAVAAAPYRKQVVIVDDGSDDGTAEALENWTASAPPLVDVVLLHHDTNRGKGAAIRTGLEWARGRVVLVQDADLEYDPAQYPRVVEPILQGQADVVFGSRYLRPEVPLPWTLNRAFVVLLNLAVRILFGRRLSDEATCYKAIRSDLIRAMDLRCERFEFCPELTAKACLMDLTLIEVPIHYRPRSHQDGKKIRWWDGVEAMATLLRWRLARFRPAVAPTYTAAAAPTVPTIAEVSTR
jgi:dolichol-phosphate mannosyltransferase